MIHPSLIRPLERSDIPPYNRTDQHQKARIWPPDNKGHPMKQWAVEKIRNKSELCIPEHFVLGTAPEEADSKASWWTSYAAYAILFALQQKGRTEDYVRSVGYAQLFHTLFPPGAVIFAVTEIDIPNLILTGTDQEVVFDWHPLALTQKTDPESKRVGYVRPDITLVTIDTSALDEHVYRAVLYWEVKNGSDHNKGFLQAVWALLVGSTLYDTRFAGLSTGQRFMRIRMDGKGRIGVDFSQQMIKDAAEAGLNIHLDGLSIEDYLAVAQLRKTGAFVFQLNSAGTGKTEGNQVFTQYCSAVGEHVFNQHHCREVPISKENAGSVFFDVPTSGEMARLKDSPMPKSAKRSADSSDSGPKKKTRTTMAEPAISNAGHGTTDNQAEHSVRIDESPVSEHADEAVAAERLMLHQRLMLQHELEEEFDDTDWQMFHTLKRIRVWPYDVLFAQ